MASTLYGIVKGFSSGLIGGVVVGSLGAAVVPTSARRVFESVAHDRDLRSRVFSKQKDQQAYTSVQYGDMAWYVGQKVGTYAAFSFVAYNMVRALSGEGNVAWGYLGAPNIASIVYEWNHLSNPKKMIQHDVAQASTAKKTKSPKSDVVA